jgi:hypothetical protein
MVQMSGITARDNTGKSEQKDVGVSLTHETLVEGGLYCFKPGTSSCVALCSGFLGNALPSSHILPNEARSKLGSLSWEV